MSEALPTPIEQGFGASDRVGARVRCMGARRVLLVTDPGVVRAGHAARVQAALEAEGVQVSVFGEVRENPTTEDVTACAQYAAAHPLDALIGLGGGSTLDTAKGCNFLLSNGGRMEDYWGDGKASQPMLPFVAIPTTAGTGSECQRFALVSRADTHQKMACGDVKALARLAVLDPELTLTQPVFVTACTGLDALAHAIECAVTRAATPASLRLAREAYRWLDGHFAAVLRDPADRPARAAMQWGAALAGAAIEHSMLGAVHAAANPLTAHYGITHGHAVGLMLPGVIRWNGRDPAAAAQYRDLLPPGVAGAVLPESAAPDAVARRVEEFLAMAGLRTSLGELGVTRDRVEGLAAEAERQWTARFNPRVVTAGDFTALYREMLR